MLEPDPRFDGYQDHVTTDDELVSIIGPTPKKVVDKVVDRLDDICRDFIAQSSFCVVATANPAGYVDVSPKGDPPGFVKVLNDRLLAIPDRPGNRRVDSFHNLLADPRVGLMFVIPGKSEVLRVRGKARIVRDQTLREAMAVNGKVPALALLVAVDAAFIHCPKCMIRGSVWQPDAWPDSAQIADINHAMIAHAKLDVTPEENFAEAEREGLTTLY
ncbi:MAG: MSMEG_1061 family FMN-dependent PPOX-type flavoprotein [Pseudomonadota bacterium]